MATNWKVISEHWGPIGLGLVVVVALVSAYATLFIQSQIIAAHAVDTPIQAAFRTDLELTKNDAAHNKEGIDDLKDGQTVMNRKLDDLFKLMLERRGGP
jgi:hypothetical protein